MKYLATRSDDWTAPWRPRKVNRHLPHVVSAVRTAGQLYGGNWARPDSLKATAYELAAVASPRRLRLLAKLARAPVKLCPDEASALVLAGIVSAAPDGTVGLSPRGREVWMALRGLCQ